MDPNITAPATKLMMDVVVNTFSRNKCRGKIGSAARCSAQIKMPVDTMAVASNPNAIADDHDTPCAPRLLNNVRLAKANVNVTAPSQSIACLTRSPRGAKPMVNPTTAKIPKGTLMMNIQCQLRFWTNHPPSRGPMMLDVEKMAANTPWILPRSRGGMTSPITAKASTNNPPPPNPCNARA